MPRGSSRRIAAIGLFAVAGVLAAGLPAIAAAPSAARAATGGVVTFGIQPQGLGKVDQRGYFTYSATPGAHLSDHAAILNYSYRPLTLRINLADANNTSTGGFALTPETQALKDVGRWISIPAAMRTVHVPARVTDRNGKDKIGEVDVPMTVVVPAKANPGDHVGGITVSLDSEAVSPTGQKYKLVQRVGARVFIRVIGPLHPRLTVENLKMTFQYSANPLGAGRATLTYTVHNTGNIALGGAQAVSVRGLFGARAKAGPIPSIPLLLPGSSVQMRVAVNDVYPEFRETGKVTISPLKVPGAVLPPAGPWTASVSVWAFPLWLLLALVLLLLLGAVEYYWRRRRMRRAAAATPDADGPSAPVRVPEKVPS